MAPAMSAQSTGIGLGSGGVGLGPRMPPRASVQHVITIGHGIAQPMGRRVTLDISLANADEALGAAFDALSPASPHWWSVHAYEGILRRSENWQAACGVGVV